MKKDKVIISIFLILVLMATVIVLNVQAHIIEEMETQYNEVITENEILNEIIDKDTLNINQIMGDLDDLMEWTIRYYEVENQTIRDEMELTEYIIWKDSKLYERILNWWS